MYITQAMAAGMLAMMVLLSVSVAGARSYPGYHTITHQQQKPAYASGTSEPTCYLPAPYIISNLRASLTPKGDMVACGDLSTRPVADRIEAWDLWAMQIQVSACGPDKLLPALIPAPQVMQDAVARHTYIQVLYDWESNCSMLFWTHACAGRCYDAVKAVTFAGHPLEATLTKQNRGDSIAVKVAGLDDAPLTKYVYSGYHSPIEVCIIMTGRCADPTYLHTSITYFSVYGPHFCATSDLPALSGPVARQDPTPSPASATYSPASVASSSSLSSVDETPSPVPDPFPSPAPYQGPSASPTTGNGVDPSATTPPYMQDSKQDAVDRTTFIWHSTY